MNSKTLLKIGALGAGCAVGALLLPEASQAFDNRELASSRPHVLSVSDLAGPWAISLGGNTGCGASTLYATVTLDANGKGTARLQGKSTGCPASDDPNQSFEITSLNADGSGTAGLSCGPGCGWEFNIQVPRGNPNIFTLVDITPDNPNNTLVGTAALAGTTIVRN